MSMDLPGWATRQFKAVIIAAVLVIAAGIYAFINLPVDAIPDITGVQVQINTTIPSLAPEEIEHLVTLPIERAMAGQPGLDETRSLTKTGLSQVTLVYKDGADQFQARQLVTERLTAVRDQLPAGATPVLAPITTGLGEIYYYTLQWRHPPPGMTETQQLMELYETQEYVVRPMLRQVEGIADVNSNGGYEAQFVIEPNVAKLTAAGLTVGELGDRIMESTRDAGGGVIHRDGDQLTVRTNARVTTAAMIAALPVKFASGVTPLTVGAVADVGIGHALRQGAATADGHQTVLGTVMMLVGQNSREVAARVATKMPEVQAALPKGMIVRTEYNRADLVDRTVSTVKRNLGEGALLVAIVLLLVMGNWRAALIVTAVIPLAFLSTISGMYVFGVSGNLMSLGALDFGLVVDGSIVVVENALRLLAEAARNGEVDAKQRRDIVAKAAAQVARPVGFGVAIITLVYVPILSLGGVEGKLFHPMAQAVMLALVSALIATFTIVPAVASRLLLAPKPTKDGNKSGVIRYAERAYAPLLDRSLAHPLLLSVGALCILGVTVAIFLSMGQQFTPQLDEGAITAMVYKPVGQSLPVSLAAEEATERDIMRRFPMVSHTFSRIGSSEIATDPMPPEQNDLYIFYKPEADWGSASGAPTDKQSLIDQMRKAEGRFDHQTFEFAQPIQMRFNEMLEGTKGDISVKIFGDDYDVLDKAAVRAKKILQGIPGTADVQFETPGRTKSEVFTPDRQALVRLNLGAAAVNDAIETALAGKQVGYIPEGDHQHAVVVRLPEDERSDSNAVLSLPVRVPAQGFGTEGMVTVHRVARVSVVKTVEPILHDDTHRRAALMINLSSSDLEGYVQKARAAFAQQLHLPAGYRVEFGGQFHQLEQARARLSIVVPAALAMIFVLVWFALGSVRRALVVYTGIPFAVTGGVLALWLRGMPFSITAAIGFIALSGIAMLNGLVMIDHIGTLRDGDDGCDLDAAVRRGAHDRLRPVLATAFCASIGFVPMAIATGAGAEVQRPLATVVIGGIITSTILTLLLLPSLYRWVEARRGDATLRHVDQPIALRLAHDRKLR